MAHYKVPFYVTLGMSIMVVAPDGAIMGVPIQIEEVGEEGIQALIETTVEKLERETPVHRITELEYLTWSQAMVAYKQAKDLNEIIQEKVKSDALDPDRVDQIMAVHKGRPGGDA